MKYILILCACLLMPVFANAKINISEIAWMGISGTNGQFGEWIEFYNDSETSVDMAGWKVFKGDKKLLFTLSQIIPAYGYLVVKRKTASIPDPLPEIAGELLSFSNSGLSNSGEDLVVENKDGVEMEKLSFATKWPAGNAEKKETMQWGSEGWVTAIGTPGKSLEPAEEEIEHEEKSDAPEDAHKAHIPMVSENKPRIAFSVPGLVYANVPYQYSAVPTFSFNFKPNQGSYVWSMGDGTTYQFSTHTTISHVYKYPGTYTLTFTYHGNGDALNDVLVGVKKIEVFSPDIAMSMVGNNAVKFENKSGRSIDVSGWYIVSVFGNTPIPNGTIITERKSITISFSALGIRPVTEVWLADPMGNIIASTIVSEVKGEAMSISKEELLAPLIAPQEQDEISVMPVATEHIIQEEIPPKTMNRTQIYIYGAATLIGIGLFLLLQRFKAY